MTTSKPLVFHDYFGIRGGGERLVLTLAKALEADLVYGYRQPESYDAAMFPTSATDLALPKYFRRSGLRAAALALRFQFMRATAARRKVRIFSGVAAPFAAPHRRDGGRNIYYCHTPPRFLYDQKSLFVKSGLNAFAQQLALAHFETGYKAMVERMDVIIANSENIQARIARYLHRDSIVVYPPCDTKSFSHLGQGNYYLSTARVSGLKRVGSIVDAFLTMPEHRLIVVSGGEDLSRLKERARGTANIEFLGWVDEATLRRLVGEAIATLYGPVDEDFGMSPVESMAAGKPVIGVAEGGLRETIVDGKTGFLLPPGFKASDIVAAVKALPPSRAGAMRRACEVQAERFSVERFVDAMKRVVYCQDTR